MRVRSWTQVGLAGRSGIAAVGAAAVAVAAGALASVALGATGDLQPRGCIEVEGGPSPSPCASQAPGLEATKSISVSPDGRRLYSVSTYTITTMARNPLAGGLAYKQCLTDGPGDPGCADTPSLGLVGADGIAISPDGKFVYTLSGSGLIAILVRTHAGLEPDGCVARPSLGAPCDQTAPGLFHGRAMAMSPDGGNIYVASDRGTVSVFDRDASTGALAYAGCVQDAEMTKTPCAQSAAGLDLALSLAVTPDGGSVYVGGHGDQAIAAFSRDTSGVLTPIGCVDSTAVSSPDCAQHVPNLDDTALAVSPGSDTLYASGYGSTDDTISILGRDPTSGGLTYLGCVKRSGSTLPCSVHAPFGVVDSLAVSSDGRSLYTAGGPLVNFHRDPTTGLLADRGCYYDKALGSKAKAPAIGRSATRSCAQLDGYYGGDGVALSPDGTSLYSSAFDGAASEHDGNLYRFDRSTP
jgi:DNA-binding beta-propeller fold protein YncE